MHEQAGKRGAPAAGRTRRGRPVCRNRRRRQLQARTSPTRSTCARRSPRQAAPPSARSWSATTRTTCFRRRDAACGLSLLVGGMAGRAWSRAQWGRRAIMLSWWRWRSVCCRRKARKAFFFEKKKQKAFAPAPAPRPTPAPQPQMPAERARARSKSLLLLFFRKEGLAYFRNISVSRAASANPTRRITTPAGIALSSREGVRRSSKIKTPPIGRGTYQPTERLPQPQPRDTIVIAAGVAAREMDATFAMQDVRPRPGHALEHHQAQRAGLARPRRRAWHPCPEGTNPLPCGKHPPASCCPSRPHAARTVVCRLLRAAERYAHAPRAGARSR